MSIVLLISTLWMEEWLCFDTKISNSLFELEKKNRNHNNGYLYYAVCSAYRLIVKKELRQTADK